MSDFYFDSDLAIEVALSHAIVHDSSDEQASDLYKPGDIVEIWNNVFKWDEYCVSYSKMAIWRFRGDALADAALPILMGPAGERGGTDLLARLKAAATGPAPVSPEIEALWHQLHNRPTDPDFAWPDAEQVRLGQAVFYRYAIHFLTSLLHFSLSAGFASPRIARVLNVASYLVPPMTSSAEGEAPRISKASNDRSFKRLMETTQFVLDCMPDGALEPGAEGWAAAVRVRLLHATMRQRLLNRVRRDQEAGRAAVYEPDRDGVPISMEDMAGTLSSFGPSPLICAMKVGMVPTTQECEDYIALWRVIGYYIGIDEEILSQHFTTYRRAISLFGSSLINIGAGESSPPPPCQFPFEQLAPGITRDRLIQHEITPNNSIAERATKTDPWTAPSTLPVLLCICHRFPMPFTFGQHCAAVRQLIGPDLSDWLSVPRATWWEGVEMRMGFAVLNTLPRFANWWRSGWDQRYRTAVRRSVEDAVAMELGNRHTKFRPRGPGQYEPAPEADEQDTSNHWLDLAGAFVQWGLLYTEMAAVVLSPAVLGIGAFWVYRRGTVGPDVIGRVFRSGALARVGRFLRGRVR